MKRLRIMKSYAILWLFIYFLIYSNLATIKVFFMATLTFNLAVTTILVIGIIMLMKASTNLVMLAGTFGILAYKKDNLAFYLKDIDKIMPANIAHMFNTRAEKGVMLFTSEESRDVIEWIEDKFFNQNRYTNYFIGTVLMIGLLGTFTGLLIAIDDMGRIILSLSGDIDLGKVISDFSGPLGGMAVGFGSSLFGVISAIILGLKGYILNKNQEVLIEGVEDWLKGRIINVGSTTSVGVDGSQLPDQQNSFMDVFIEQISNMTNEMKNISTTNERLHSITIASVQQARDEHELSISIMENMHTSLESIDTHTQQSSKLLQEQFTLLNDNMHSDKDEAVEAYKQSIETLFARLETALTNAQDSISTEFAKMNEQSAQITQTHISKITSALGKIDDHLSQEKAIIEELVHETKNSSATQQTQLADVSKLLQSSLSTITKEEQTLQNLSQQVQQNDKNSAEHIQNIIASISQVGETLSLEVQQLGNMEDIQKAQSIGLERNLTILEEMKDTLKSSNSSSNSAITELKDIKGELSNLNTEVSQNSRIEITKVATEIKTLRELMKDGQDKQANLITEQKRQSDLSEQGNDILQNILRDQKEQMTTLLSQQENMLIEQKNLYALDKDTADKENANFKLIHENTQTTLKEQEGFRDEHRMLLQLTQRSSELSEEASGMNLDKASENLEALEKLILENQNIKSEIQNLTDTINRKSFGSSDGGDGFISRFFK